LRGVRDGKPDFVGVRFAKVRVVETGWLPEGFEVARLMACS
jgi:hypothetical protein